MQKGFFDLFPQLAKNPLGILALFIALVYAVAALVVGFAGDKFNQCDQHILILFVTLFPCLVLLTFTYLVVKHHKKFYGPGDFRTDEGFLGTSTLAQQAEVKEEQVSAILESQPAVPGTGNIAPSPLDDPNDFDPRVRVRKDIFLAETLAMNWLQSEYGIPIKREVALKFGTERHVFDGAMSEGNNIVVIEVKFFPLPTIHPASIERLIASFNKIYEHTQRPETETVVRAIVVFVMNFDKGLEEKFYEQVKKRMIGATKLPMEFRFIQLSELQQKAGFAPKKT